MLKAKEFAAWCVSMIGQPYWYGTCVYSCTESMLERKTRQYPLHYTDARMSQYKRDIAKGCICADCVGACKGYAWEMGESKETVPDKSANGMFEYAKKQGADWGTIASIPDEAGIAVRYDGHVGYYMGDGTVIEWRGFKYGCVRTKLKDRKWTHWYRLPWLEYDIIDIAATVPEKPVLQLGTRLLKRGCTGEDVVLLQQYLQALDYGSIVGEADGDFGAMTMAAVMAFQSDNCLEVDGKYGEKSHAAMMQVIADIEADSVMHDPYLVTVRSGNGGQYAVLREVYVETELPVIAVAENGWKAVDLGDCVGWIEGGSDEQR